MNQQNKIATNRKTLFEMKAKQKYPAQTELALTILNQLLEEIPFDSPGFDTKDFWRRLNVEINTHNSSALPEIFFEPPDQPMSRKDKLTLNLGLEAAEILSAKDDYDLEVAGIVFDLTWEMSLKVIKNLDKQRFFEEVKTKMKEKRIPIKRKRKS